MANNADPGSGGGSDEDATTSSINLGAFLTDSESISGFDGFNLASGIDAVRVAQASIAGVAFALAYGVNSFIEAAAEVATRIVDGVAGFVADGLIASTLGVGVSAIEGAWSYSLAEFGVLSYPFALISLLATWYVVSWGIGTAQEVLA